MTTDKKEFQVALNRERQLYGLSKKNLGEKRFRHTKNYMLWQAVKSLRVYEFRCALRDAASNPVTAHWHSLRVKWADRRKNKACEAVDVELTPDMIGSGLRLCHDNIVIFGRVGENCTFHGNNVVGNKRTGDGDSIPKLGSNVDVGFGALIIGDVEIADDCVIGAGAVVTKSFTTPGSVLVGVPAKAIEK